MSHYFSALIIAITFSANISETTFAQGFVNLPNDSIAMEGQFEELTQLNIQQKNISFEPISLKWKKVSVSLPAFWKASACDNANCYTSLVDSGEMLSINPNELGMLMIDITARVNYGVATIRYAVWDAGTPALKDTLTYILTVNAPLGFEEMKKQDRFSISPNPANENIQIISNMEIGFRYIITDVLGKTIDSRKELSNKIILSTDTFPNGLYNIFFYDQDKFLCTKKIFIQH